MSAAVVYSSSVGSPSGLVKCVSASPISFALSFIICVNAVGAAGQLLCERHRRVVARRHHQAVQQVVHGDPLPDLRNIRETVSSIESRQAFSLIVNRSRSDSCRPSTRRA